MRMGGDIKGMSFCDCTFGTGPNATISLAGSAFKKPLYHVNYVFLLGLQQKQ